MTQASRGEGSSGVQESVAQAASQVKDQVKGTVGEQTQAAGAKAGDRLRSEVDRRSTQVGEQAESLAGALRRAAGQLQDEGRETPARLAHQASERIEQLGGHLRRSTADDLLDQVEGFARRRPWVAGGLAAAAGFLGSRFLKASSGSRYAAHGRAGGDVEPVWEPDPELERTLEPDASYPATAEVRETLVAPAPAVPPAQELP